MKRTWIAGLLSLVLLALSRDVARSQESTPAADEVAKLKAEIENLRAQLAQAIEHVKSFEAREQEIVKRFQAERAEAEARLKQAGDLAEDARREIRIREEKFEVARKQALDEREHAMALAEEARRNELVARKQAIDERDQAEAIAREARKFEAAERDRALAVRAQVEQAERQVDELRRAKVRALESGASDGNDQRVVGQLNSALEILRRQGRLEEAEKLAQAVEKSGVFADEATRDRRQAWAEMKQKLEGEANEREAVAERRARRDEEREHDAGVDDWNRQMRELREDVRGLREEMRGLRELLERRLGVDSTSHRPRVEIARRDAATTPSGEIGYTVDVVPGPDQPAKKVVIHVSPDTPWTAVQEMLKKLDYDATRVRITRPDQRGGGPRSGDATTGAGSSSDSGADPASDSTLSSGDSASSESSGTQGPDRR